MRKVPSELGRWEYLKLPGPGSRGHLVSAILHALARTHASFDSPDLVSRVGLVPVMALARQAGLVARHVA